MIDSLQSVQLVTAKGDLITVSATENADLFWGLRGAGMNFGVITQATYDIYDLTNSGNVQSADLIFQSHQAEDYFNVLVKAVECQPANFAIITVGAYDVQNHCVSSLSTSPPQPRATETNGLISAYSDN
jgi:fumiquinazoline A oxidase